jgi:hypothetical protein
VLALNNAANAGGYEVTRRVAALVLSIAVSGLPALGQETTIKSIDDATYGVEEEIAKQNGCGDGAFDVAASVRQLCTGKSSCRIPVHNQSMGGDPCKGAAKELDIGYTCSDGSAHAAACGEANQMLILCPTAKVPEGGFDCEYDQALEQGK